MGGAGGRGGGMIFLVCPLLQRQFWLKYQKTGDALFHEIRTPNTQIYCMLLKIAYLPGEVVGGGGGERDFC